MEPGANTTSTGAAPSMSLEDDLFGDSMTNPDNVPTVAEEEAIAPVASPTGQVTDAQVAQMDEEEEEVGDDLFGDGDDDEDAMDQDQTATAGSDDDGLTSTQRAERKRMEYDEAEGSDRDVTPDYEEKEQTIAEIKLGNFGRPPEGKVWHARLPNFLSLDSTPFDHATWEPPTKEDNTEDEEGARQKAELPDENVIRWRWGKNEKGEDVKESNSRVVRWSDGSLSLQVGSELFDISATVDHSALLSSTAATPLIPSSHAPELNNFNQSRQHGLTYLTAKHSYTQLVEAQASVHGTITFRPTTLHSATHRRLAGTVNTQHAKTRAIRMAAVPERDPERAKLEKEKAEEDRARKLKREQQRAAGGGGGARRKLGARPGTRMVMGSDEEESDAGSDGGVYERREQPRRSTQQDEDGYDDDGFVVNSDEEEERTRGGRGDEEVEEADERIEREERRRKDRRRKERDFSDSDDDSAAEAEPEPTAQRRRVVADSDEE